MQRKTADGEPISRWIARWGECVAGGGSVLDLACGGGRHARYFADRGHRVTGVDRDLSGVADLCEDPRFEWVEADLEHGAEWPFPAKRFAAVVVTNYLWRPILPRIFAAVAAGGWLLYETFGVGNEAYGRPRNPDFLLEPDELLACRGHGLGVVAYECGVAELPTPRVVQRIAAIRASAPARLECP